MAALEKAGKPHLAAHVLEKLSEGLQAGELLEVNLALCKGGKIAVPETWVLRRGWLEAQSAANLVWR